MDVVGGVLLADGTGAKILTGIDDHSRYVVCAGVMERATSRAVCSHFAEAMRIHGVPQEVLTDNGKVFTGRFAAKDIEVLFDRTCRENGIDHLLTAPRSPTTTGKIERFHRTLRSEFLTGRVFDDLPSAQAELDAWVGRYNTERPHQSLSMATPASRFSPASSRPADASALVGERTGEEWISRKVTTNGDHLGRLAGDQLRQAPGRAPRRHPAPGPDAADLGRRRAAEDGPSHEREGGQEEARGTGELTVRR